MANLDNITSPIVNPEAQSDFLAERKRLREVRARWVDDHEKPIAMLMCECPKCRLSQLKAEANVCVRCGESLEKAILLANPFLTGCQTYPDDLDYEATSDGYKRPEITFLPAAQDAEQAQVTAQVGEVTKQYNQFSGITTRDRSGAEVSFSHKSDHPPIREGETHEEWFARVSNAYSKTENDQTDARSSGANPNHLRATSDDDSNNQRPRYSTGAKDSGSHRESGVDSRPIVDNSGGPKPGSPRTPAQFLSGFAGSSPAAETANSFWRRLWTLRRNRKD